MRKKSFFVWSLVAALVTTACSDQSEDIQSGEKGEFSFEVDFGATPNSRAVSTAIPETSWSNIDRVQFFLYDNSGNTVKYSAIADPTSNVENPKKFIYTDVPVTSAGQSYTLVAVANSNSSTFPIVTNVPSVGAMAWNTSNVREKLISGLTIEHKPASFPAYTTPNSVPTALAAYATPSEIFMAEYATPVTITAGNTTTTSTPLKLQREVAMMRVRLNIVDSQAGVDNVNSVDWTGSDVSVLIYNIQDRMGIAAGNAGGVSNSSGKTNVQIGATSFNTADPTSGYGSGTILSPNFDRWVDIPVFPNNGGRASALSPGDDSKVADAAQRFSVVVTAKGKAGHVLANGTTMNADGTIYWEGQIQEAFFPNYIREVNLTLKTGGTIAPLPETPTEQGNLTITVSNPEPWNSNILTVNKDL